jgi:hypothetical protein
MKRKLLVAVPLLCIVALLAWLFRPKHETLGEGYISESSVTLWSSIAQVREPIDSLHYGDKVEIVARHNDFTKVRSSGGAVGWVDARLVMEPALWQRSAKLLDEARALPVQARGRTKVATNLRALPGRTQPRLYQFGRGIPVEIVGRSIADWAQVADEKETNESSEPRKEEWLFIRGLATRPPGENNVRVSETTTTTQPGDQTIPIAGWIVGRFVELTLPDAVREGTSSANVRAVAWFELNRPTDPPGAKPQYLVAGTRGPDWQPCDFTNIRVYTWNPKKTRYETAFIENNLCGRMPIRVGKSPKGEPEFRFLAKATTLKASGPKATAPQTTTDNEERVYRLMQTVVRRIREGGAPVAAATKKSKAPSKAKPKVQPKKKAHAKP